MCHINRSCDQVWLCIILQQRQWSIVLVTTSATLCTVTNMYLWAKAKYVDCNWIVYDAVVVICKWMWCVSCRLVQGRPSQLVACGQHVAYDKACGDIWNEKMSFNPFLGEVEIETRSSFEHSWAIYLWAHTQHYHLIL